MKTLLLSLVVMVGFVYLVSGDNRTCYSDTGILCLGTEECAEGENLCYKKITKEGLLRIKVVKGCGCPVPGENEKVTCCATDKCNC
ncbi:toxin 3FTx-Dis4-like [Pituophis catenifer annectens]|uniref:toxin 3FTx-Dis4-like n=1 Tax=Pituophis catenifer annectens TaxID=94852 RepID=UPI003995FEC6